MSTILVTGANRGIGLSLCKQLVERGHKVIGGCRHVSNELRVLPVQVESLDVTDGGSISQLADRLEGPIDWVINNAGIMSTQSLDHLEVDRIRDQFEVNALGPLRVTAALRGMLKTGSKVGIVTSRMGSIEDNTSGGSYGYRMSKAAANMAGKSLANDLKSRGIAVILLHPGWVKTDMTGGTGNWGPDDAAAGLIARMEELTMETTGTFRHANGDHLPW